MAPDDLTPGRGIKLSEERRVAGSDILQLTDKVGFNATVAAWVWSAATGHWHFLLVSYMIDSEGPIWVYERLLKAFSVLKLPDSITPLDIKIASPRQVEFVGVGLRKTDETGIIELTDLSLNKLGIDYMALYRWRDLPNNLGDRTREFDRRVSLLAA